jgi:hypothetical protein
LKREEISEYQSIRESKYQYISENKSITVSKNKVSNLIIRGIHLRVHANSGYEAPASYPQMMKIKENSSLRN